MSENKCKLEKRKLQYEIWSIDTKDEHQALNLIRQIIHSNYNLLDKNLLYISSAAFAFSITFLGQFHSNDISKFWKIILALAWGSFGLTIILSIIGFKLSNNTLVRLQQNIVENQINALKFYLSNDSLDDVNIVKSLDERLNKITCNSTNKKKSSIEMWAIYINRSQIGTFIFGLLLLFVFVIKVYFDCEL